MTLIKLSSVMAVLLLASPVWAGDFVLYDRHGHVMLGLKDWETQCQPACNLTVRPGIGIQFGHVPSSVVSPPSPCLATMEAAMKAMEPYVPYLDANPTKVRAGERAHLQVLERWQAAKACWSGR